MKTTSTTFGRGVWTIQAIRVDDGPFEVTAGLLREGRLEPFGQAADDSEEAAIQRALDSAEEALNRLLSPPSLT